MAEIGFENGRNSNFEGFVTLTLTLDPPIRHPVVHHSSTSRGRGRQVTSTYIPNFIQIKETFCGRTDGRTFFPSNIIRSTFGSRPKNQIVYSHAHGVVRRIFTTPLLLVSVFFRPVFPKIRLSRVHRRPHKEECFCKGNANRFRNLTLNLTLTLCLYVSDKWPFGQVNCYHANHLKWLWKWKQTPRRRMAEAWGRRGWDRGGSGMDLASPSPPARAAEVIPHSLVRCPDC